MRNDLLCELATRQLQKGDAAFVVESHRQAAHYKKEARAKQYQNKVKLKKIKKKKKKSTKKQTNKTNHA